MSMKIACVAMTTVLASGCVSPPTIAHVHIGHAIDGARDTPGKEGYLVLAERRAQEAHDLATRANTETSPAQRKLLLVQLNVVVNGADNYSLVNSVQEIANHISYSATSDDASANVRQFTQKLPTLVDPVVSSGQLISLLVTESQGTNSNAALQELADAIYAESDSILGKSNPAAPSGIRSVRLEIDNMIARENPPYSTVARWYLFNIFRRDDGSWFFQSPAGNQTADGSY